MRLIYLKHNLYCFLSYTTNGGSCQIEKDYEVLKIMVKAAILICTGVVQKWYQQESEW